MLEIGLYWKFLLDVSNRGAVQSNSDYVKFISRMKESIKCPTAMRTPRKPCKVYVVGCDGYSTSCLLTWSTLCVCCIRNYLLKLTYQTSSLCGIRFFLIHSSIPQEKVNKKKTTNPMLSHLKILNTPLFFCMWFSASSSIQLQSFLLAKVFLFPFFCCFVLFIRYLAALFRSRFSFYLFLSRSLLSLF